MATINNHHQYIRKQKKVKAIQWTDDNSYDFRMFLENHIPRGWVVQFMSNRMHIMTGRPGLVYIGHIKPGQVAICEEGGIVQVISEEELIREYEPYSPGVFENADKEVHHVSKEPGNTILHGVHIDGNWIPINPHVKIHTVQMGNYLVCVIKFSSESWLYQVYYEGRRIDEVNKYTSSMLMAFERSIQIVNQHKKDTSENI